MDSILLQLQPELFKFALGLTKDTDEALDLLQETSLRVLLHKDKFKENTNARAWIFTIMKNTFINNWRIKNKRIIINEHSQDGLLLQGSIKECPINPDNLINIKEITSFLDSLNPYHRMPLKLYMEGYSYEEIAKNLCSPIGTIKSRIYIARQQLTKKLITFINE